MTTFPVTEDEVTHDWVYDDGKTIEGTVTGLEREECVEQVMRVLRSTLGDSVDAEHLSIPYFDK